MKNSSQELIKDYIDLYKGYTKDQLKEKLAKLQSFSNRTAYTEARIIAIKLLINQ